VKAEKNPNMKSGKKDTLASLKVQFKRKAICSRSRRVRKDDHLGRG